MQSFTLLAHEFGRFAAMGMAGVLLTAGAINSAVADAPTTNAQAAAAVQAAADAAKAAAAASAAEQAHIVFNSPLPGFSINSRFGLRKLPGQARRMHEGVDYAAPVGSPILASAEGVVLHAGTSPTYGNYIEVDHGEGVTTFYAHMTRRAPGLGLGDRVAAGQTLGFVGSTGRSTGPHLHFEIRKDERQFDPMKVLGRTFASLTDLPFGRGARGLTTVSSSGPGKPVPYTIIRGRVRS